LSPTRTRNIGREGSTWLKLFLVDEAMLDATLAGASGYVVKDIKGMDLAKAITDVAQGNRFSTTGRPPL